MNYRKFYNCVIGGCIVAFTISCSITKTASEPLIVKNTTDIEKAEPIAKPAKVRPQIDPTIAADNLNEINKYIDELSMWTYVERVIAPYETIDEVINQDSINIFHRVIASYNSIQFPSEQNANSLNNVIEFLLQKKADVDLLNDNGEDALSAFLKIGSSSSRTLDTYNRNLKHHSAEILEPIVTLFIENGANIKLKDNSGVSTFERIVDFAGIDFIKLQLENDIDINDALNIALKCNNLELSNYLLENGAILDTSTEDGKIAFFHAITTIDDFELFKTLVDKTSDINAILVTKDRYSQNALSRMMYLGQNKKQQSQKNYINKIVYLLDKGIKIVEQDWEKQGQENSLIELALNTFKYNQAEIICNKLIEKGANVNLTYYHTSPLFKLFNNKFAYYPIEPLVTLLIEKGADVNFVKREKTILDLMPKYLSSEKEEVKIKAEKFSKVLKSKGAKTFAELDK